MQSGNIVNVIVLTLGPDATTVYVTMSNNNFLVVFPDFLLTTTSLAISFNCLRRSVLSGFMSCYQENKYSIFGRLRHDLMEVVLISQYHL